MKLLVLLIGVQLYYGNTNAELMQWSRSYTLTAILTVPNANISESYQVWVDHDAGKARVDFYGGMDKLYTEYDRETDNLEFYKVFPETNKDLTSVIKCEQLDPDASDDIRLLTEMYSINVYLPIKDWNFVGVDTVNGVISRKYIYEEPTSIEDDIEDTKEIYTVWVDSEVWETEQTIPIRYVYELHHGKQVRDYFRHDYLYYDPSKPASSDVQRPAMQCPPVPKSSLYEPVDPLMEFVKPEIEDNRVKIAFERFKIKHNKRYTNEEEHFKRMNNFKHNLRFINSFNRQHRSFSVGINHMADLSKEEISKMLGTKMGTHNIDYNIDGSGDYDNDVKYQRRVIVESSGDHSDGIGDQRMMTIEGNGDDDEEWTDMIQGTETVRFDWRNYGAVTPVKDQTSTCGGCYAFTTAAAIESSAYVARGCQRLDEVSEQVIIDCTWGSDTDKNGNLGCIGGTYEYALEWVKTHGVPLRSDYGPYLAMEGKCHIKEMNKLVRIDGYQRVEKPKRVIKEALRNNGPLLVSMDTNHMSFLFYEGGIYDEPECSNNGNDRTHGVTLVGYGREQDQEFWVIKNSFGQDWGENGYMRINTARNRCGIKNFVYKIIYNNENSSQCKPL